MTGYDTFETLVSAGSHAAFQPWAAPGSIGTECGLCTRLFPFVTTGPSGQVWPFSVMDRLVFR